MAKPKSRPRQRSVEEPAKDDETRLETFERGTENRNGDALSPDAPDSLVPANERLDLDD